MLDNIPDPWVVLADPGIQDILEVREQGNLLVHQVCRELGRGLEGLEIKTTTKFERSRRIVKFKKIQVTEQQIIMIIKQQKTKLGLK